MDNRSPCTTCAEGQPADARSHKPRWWPAAAVLALTALAIVWISAIEDTLAQARNLQTLIVGLVATLLLLTWWLFFSRLRWPVRLFVIVTIVATAAGMGLLVDIGVGR